MFCLSVHGWAVTKSRTTFTSSAAGYTACNEGQDCETHSLADREDLLALLPGAEQVGFLPVGSGGVLFAIQVGDTPHAYAPLLWCADPACADRTPLAGIPGDRQLAIQPRGTHVLVTDEYTRDDARVYRFGEAGPIAELHGTAVWLPEGALGAE